MDHCPKKGKEGTPDPGARSETGEGDDHEDLEKLGVELDWHGTRGGDPGNDEKLQEEKVRRVRTRMEAAREEHKRRNAKVEEEHARLKAKGRLNNFVVQIPKRTP